MKKLTTKIIFILALLAGVVLVLKIISSQNAKSLPQVILVSPQNNEENVSINPKIEIEFDKPANEKKISVTFLPEVEFSQIPAEDKLSLIIQSSFPLNPSTTYNFVIKYGKQTIWQSSFKTIQLEGDASIPIEGQKYTEDNFPLAQYIPYETGKYSVRYSLPLTLKVTIINGIKKEIETEINAWMKSKGVEPKTHQFVWVEPTPGP